MAHSKQVKDYLKKNGKISPLSQVNQLLIISNFATLRLKGVSRTQASLEIARQWHEGQGNWFARRVQALARHYQIFEKIPIEKRGGSSIAQKVEEPCADLGGIDIEGKVHAIL